MRKKEQIVFIPQPQKISWQEEGMFRLSYDSRILLGNGAQSMMHAARMLAEEIQKDTGFEVAISGTVSPKKQDIYLEYCESLEEEQYELFVSQEGVRICGGAPRGLLYGVQTLRQLIRQCAALLPCVRIEDQPQLPDRGFYHDVTRGRIPTMAYLKTLVEKMSFYKLNQLQLYIEHSFLFEGMSELWRDSTPLTAQDILELDEYCLKFGVELVPSLASFGHLYHLLRTKQFAGLCELEHTREKEFSFTDRMLHHTINVEDPQGMDLIKKMISEYMELFTSRRFNICADETFDLGKGKNRERAEREGVTGMYMGHVKELCEFVLSKDRQPMFWGDIICGFPKEIKNLPKETICLNWGYAPDQSEEDTRKLKEAGAVQYLCSGVQGWNNWINPLRDGYENIRRMASYAVKYQAPGLLNTDWGDYGHINHPDFSIPGMIYGAAFSWNKEIPEFSVINRAISLLEYGNFSEKVLELTAQIPMHERMNWWMAVRFLEKCREETNGSSISCLSLFKQLCLEKSAHFNMYEEENRELRMLQDQLRCEMSNTDTEHREALALYVMTIDAICIFNEIGAAFNEELVQMKQETLWGLAQRLETWFYYYKKLWRKVSQEAELDRIQDVINWYADLLRDIPVKQEK